MFAPPSSYKSFLALDLALHVAAGRPCWGRTVQQGAVVYVAGEGHEGLPGRAEAARQHHGLPTGLPFMVPANGLDLTHAGRVTDFIESVRKATRGSPVGLVILDTWSRATAGAAENDNGAVSGLVAACDRIRDELGCTVLIVHHGTDAPRGATALPAAADTVLRIEPNRANRTATVRVTKQRHAAEAPPITLRLSSVAGSLAVEHVTADAPEAVFPTASAPVRQQTGATRRATRQHPGHAPGRKSGGAPTPMHPSAGSLAGRVLTELRGMSERGGQVDSADLFARCVAGGLFLPVPARATPKECNAAMSGFRARLGELAKAGLLRKDAAGALSLTG